MGEPRTKQRAENLKPFSDQPLRKMHGVRAPSVPLHEPYGDPVFHGVNPTWFAMPLPPSSKGPIRAAQARGNKGIDGYPGAQPPEFAKAVRPPRRSK